MGINNEIYEQIKQLAKENPDGFTFDMRKEKLYTDRVGYAVGLSHITDLLFYKGIRGLELRLMIENKVFSETEHYLDDEVMSIGGWYNKENGTYCVDIGCVVKDKEMALKLGRAYGQISIWDFANGQEIKC